MQMVLMHVEANSKQV